MKTNVNFTLNGMSISVPIYIDYIRIWFNDSKDCENFCYKLNGSVKVDSDGDSKEFTLYDEGAMIDIVAVNREEKTIGLLIDKIVKIIKEEYSKNIEFSFESDDSMCNYLVINLK